MGLAGNGSRADGNTLQVIDDARGGGAEMIDGERKRIRGIEKIFALPGREINSKGGE